MDLRPRYGHNRAMMGRYLVAWLGMMVLAVANGGLRDVLYKDRVGELAAHQISTAALLVLLTAYFWLVTRLWPLRSARQAWSIGAAWLVMTLAFELVMGRLVVGNSWDRVLDDYNVLAGRVWVLVPLWVLVGPYAFFRLGRGR